MAKKPATLNCFFVTPIGAAGSAERKRADNVLKHVLREALGSSFEIVRADEVDDPGTISGDVISRLYNADLVVADLTGTNPNVMYELGIRHSFSKPIVQVCQAGEKLPFDIADERTVFFDLASLDDVAEARTKISKAALRAMEVKPFKSPVVRALEFQTLFTGAAQPDLSETFVEKLEEIDDSVQQLQGDIASLEFAVSSISVNVEPMDYRTLEELQEIAQKFYHLSPSDMAELSKAAKQFVRSLKEAKD